MLAVLIPPTLGFFIMSPISMMVHGSSEASAQRQSIMPTLTWECNMRKKPWLDKNKLKSELQTLKHGLACYVQTLQIPRHLILGIESRRVLSLTIKRWNPSHQMGKTKAPDTIHRNSTSPSIVPSQANALCSSAGPSPWQNNLWKKIETNNAIPGQYSKDSTYISTASIYAAKLQKSFPKVTWSFLCPAGSTILLSSPSPPPFCAYRALGGIV